MENENMENQDALNLEGVQDTIPEIESDDVSEKLTKVNEYAKNQKIRAEKAEQESKNLKAELAKHKETETPKNEEKKSNEPDYAKLAFLKAEGVTHPDDQKIIQDEADRLKLPLTDVLQMEHIKSRLKTNNDKRVADSGTPGTPGKSGGTSQGDVDYWLDKKKTDKEGNEVFDNPDDLELFEKVSNARMTREKNKSMFEPIH
jgi:hypothetical protein